MKTKKVKIEKGQPTNLVLTGLMFETPWGWTFNITRERDEAEEPDSEIFYWTITVRPPFNAAFPLVPLKSKEAGYSIPAVYRTHGKQEHAVNYAREVAEFYR